MLRQQTDNERIVGLLVPNAADETGIVISVVQYFRDKYDVHLRYHLLSAIQAGMDAKRTVITSEMIQVNPMKQVSVYSIERIIVLHPR